MNAVFKCLTLYFDWIISGKIYRSAHTLRTHLEDKHTVHIIFNKNVITGPI